MFDCFFWCLLVIIHDILHLTNFDAFQKYSLPNFNTRATKKYSCFTQK